MSLADLTKNDTLAPTVSYTTECDGSVNNGIVTDLPDDNVNRSNLSMIVFHETQSKNYHFEYEPFIAGSSSSTTWSLNVINKSMDAVATLTFTDKCGNDTTIVIRYFAKKLRIYPDNYNFGLLKLSEAAEKEFFAVNESNSAIIISRFGLKDYSQGFTIIFPELPHNLDSGDTLWFKIRFEAGSAGIFTDSAAVGDSCSLIFSSRIEATVGIPVIIVSDAAFNKQKLNITQTQEINITNAGNDTLRIFSYIGPENDAFVPKYLGDISPEFPLILPPNEHYSFFVDFSPLEETNYEDEIIFHGNAFGTDSIAHLTGTGVMPGLSANSYNWGRRRIDRPDRPDLRIAPYPPDYNNKAIYIENSGSEEVTIYNIEIINNIKGEAFEFNRSAFDNILIAPKSDTVINVKFHPIETGYYELVFKYPNSSGKDVETSLKGIGCLPKISGVECKFDTAVINDWLHPAVTDYKIYNLDWEFADTLLKLDFLSEPEGAVCFEPLCYGTEGFQLDKFVHQGKIQVLPGDSLVLPARFSATKAGMASAKVITLSDAESDIISNFSGCGIEARNGLIRATVQSTRTCAGIPDTIRCIIENYGNGDLYIRSLKFDPVIPEFAFIEQCCNSPVRITPGNFYSLDILYQPISGGTNSTRLLIENSSVNQPNLSLNIEGEAISMKRTLKLIPSDKISSIGETHLYSIIMEPGEDLSLAAARLLNIKIQYNGAFIDVPPNEIEPGNLIEAKFTKQIIRHNAKQGITEIALIADGANILNGDGELLRFKLKTYLPDDASDYSQITINASSQKSQCLEFLGEPSLIKLKPTCQGDIRRIIVSPFDYMISELQPNPVNGNSAELSFTIALGSHTDISIFNGMGILVDKPLSQELEPGNYTIRLDTGKYPSGIYWYEITSGPFKNVRSMIIAK